MAALDDTQCKGIVSCDQHVYSVPALRSMSPSTTRPWLHAALPLDRRILARGWCSLDWEASSVNSVTGG